MNAATLTTLIGTVLGAVGISDPGMQASVKATIAAGVALVIALHGLWLHLSHRTDAAAAVTVAQAKTAQGASFVTELHDVAQTLLTHTHDQIARLQDSITSAVQTAAVIGAQTTTPPPTLTLTPPLVAPISIPNVAPGPVTV